MPEPSHRLRFGSVDVFPAQRQLHIDGIPVAMGSRAFDVLLALIAHRDRVVTKNELLDLAWPGLVVEEGNLKVQVSTLRKLIGAQAIATIPARGYRFTATVDGDAGPPPMTDADPTVALHRSLPAAATPMLGRDDEFAHLRALMAQHRVVTVLGAGGIGKTTLALAAARQVADAQADRIAWIDVAAARDAAALPQVVAQALHLPCVDANAPLAALVAALQSRELLLVIDNAEQAIDSVAELLGSLLAGCARVRALVTSQAPLKMAAEQLYRLGPLAVPDAGVPLAEALTHGAVALFAERTRALQRQFTVDDGNLATVIGICRALDGLPLAIELAAARVPLLGVEGLAQRLGERLCVLTGGARGAPTRQQTLRAALDWSCGLLAAAERAVFRRLGVFSGGFTLDLAAAVAGDAEQDAWAVIDMLGTLVERSLVAVDCGDPPRYRLLESARAYALSMLDAAGERMPIQRRHAEAMRAEAEQAQRSLWVSVEPRWLLRHAPELDNLRAAIDWSTRHEPALAVDLIGASHALFDCLALVHESRQRADAVAVRLPALAVAPTSAARFLRVRSLQMRDVSAQTQRALALQAVRLSRDHADDRAHYETLFVLITSLRSPGADALDALREMEGLDDAGWPAALRALVKIAQSRLAYVEGRLADNHAALEAALALVAGAGADRLTVIVLADLADHALLQGAVGEAVLRGLALVALLRRMHRQAYLPLALCNLANALLQQGTLAPARQALADAFVEMQAQQWNWLRGFGDVYALLAAREGRVEAAAQLLGWADAARQQRGARQPNEARCRELAWQIIRAASDAALIERSMADGAAMTPEQVRRTALAAARPAVAVDAENRHTQP